MNTTTTRPIAAATAGPMFGVKDRHLQREHRMRIVAVQLLVISILPLVGCKTLQFPPPRVPIVNALPPAPSGLLADVSSNFSEGHPAGQSGFLLLSRNDEALQWRLALVDHATTSIDAQYFIWQEDEAGKLLLDRLLKAADRGVRVRLLLDDFLLTVKNRVIAVFAQHPNFDIKVFNPGKFRNSALGKFGGFLLNFKQLNRRMHNKLFVVDNRLAIIGGRNIGNEYFGLSEKYNFRDLDVMVAGPVVEEISNAFDKYWNAELSYPGSAMSSDATLEELEPKRRETQRFLADKSALLTSFSGQRASWQEKLMSLPTRMHAGTAHFLQDQPAIHDGEEYRLDDMIRHLARPTSEELILVTPYLIPDNKIMADIAKRTAEGARVKILTGSMGANNHTAAHSHYKKYRRPLLKIGVELYEFRHDPSPLVRETVDVAPAQADFICLHVKSIVGNRDRCFVGSLNLDPRALEINTENGLFIDSEGLCGELADELHAMMRPENAWRVSMNKRDQVHWKSNSETLSIQPARNSWQRIADFFFRLLPIEDQI